MQRGAGGEGGGTQGEWVCRAVDPAGLDARDSLGRVVSAALSHVLLQCAERGPGRGVAHPHSRENPRHARFHARCSSSPTDGLGSLYTCFVTDLVLPILLGCVFPWALLKVSRC